jgi:mannose/fructose/N-acetylgalactosamine-specific phosphotransferase system component IIC
MAPRRRRYFLAGIAGALFSVPCVILAGIAYTNVAAPFAVFVVVATLVVAALSAIWFDAAAQRAARSRSGLAVAGCVGATLTSLTSVALYSLLLSIAHGESLITTFLLYAVASLVLFWPLLLIGGVLVGLIASTKRFAL